MKSKRIQWLDFGKGFTILLVVLVHCFIMSNGFHGGGPLNDAMTIIAMPLFFAISGYLYKPSNTLHGYLVLLYKKISSFILPYLIFSLIIVLLPLSQLTHYSHNMLFYFSHIYLNPLGYLWFLYALFFIFIVAGFMNLIHINLYIQLILVTMLLIYQMLMPTHSTYNPLTGFGGYMICFYIGYVMRIYNIERIFKKKSLCLYLIGAWLILFIVETYFTGLHGVNFVAIDDDDIITKLTSIPVFFAMFICFSHRNRIFKYFDKYGKCTFIIYLIHLPVIVLTASILSSVIINNLILFIILLLFGWYSSIIVYYISRHVHIIDFIFYPRKYFNKLLNN